MKQLIIVTGGAGFIGSALIWALNSLGIEDIIVVDHLGKSSKFLNLVPLRFLDYFEKENFLQELEKPAFPGRVATIFHLGACSSTTEEDASYLAENNFAYTKSLCRWALSNDARFIYASSGATYGDGSMGFSDKADLQTLRPLNMYGYSKHMFDCWAFRNGLLSKIAGLKYFNVFGPNEYHKQDMRSVVVKAYEQILFSGKVKLFRSLRPEFEDGCQKRDFVYVKDAVRATLFFHNQPDRNGIFNIGSGRAETWISLVTAIFRALDKEPDIEFIDMPGHLRDRYQYYTCASLERLRDAGFADKFMPLEESVADYVRNYLVTGAHLDPGN